MLELTRTVRFSLNGPRGRPGAERHNGFAGWPSMHGLGRYYELRVSCRGVADAATGYCVDIGIVDRAVRECVLPFLEGQGARGRGQGKGPAAIGAVLRRSMDRLQQTLPVEVAAISLALTPFYILELRSRHMDHVILRQQFEFCAAHRLHVKGLSAAQNRKLFGKCNNPSGHGHNYRLEVAVRAPVDGRGRVVPVEQLDAVVDRTVVQRLDHMNLNIDVPEFARLNPSVENIARVIHGMLKKPVTRIGARLEEVSVWETSKTVCTYRGARK